MKTITLSEFEFEAPDGWRSSDDAGRCVCTGPCGEELVVSVMKVEAVTLVLPPPVLISLLLDGAIASMRSAASHPELVAQRECIVAHATYGEVRTLVAVTQEGVTSFEQCAVAGATAVLLATLEAPATQHATIEAWLAGLKRSSQA